MRQAHDRLATTCRREHEQEHKCTSSCSSFPPAQDNSEYDSRRHSHEDRDGNRNNGNFGDPNDLGEISVGELDTSQRPRTILSSSYLSLRLNLLLNSRGGSPSAGSPVATSPSPGSISTSGFLTQTHPYTAHGMFPSMSNNSSTGEVSNDDDSMLSNATTSLGEEGFTSRSSGLSSNDSTTNLLATYGSISSVKPNLSVQSLFSSPLFTKTSGLMNMTLLSPQSTSVLASSGGDSTTQRTLSLNQGLGLGSSIRPSSESKPFDWVHSPSNDSGGAAIENENRSDKSHLNNSHVRVPSINNSSSVVSTNSTNLSQNTPSLSKNAK